MNTPRHSRSAFTLVEVSLALLIVAVGMLGTLAVIPQGSRASKDAREDTYAAMVAQSALSSLRGHIQKGLAPATWEYVPSGFHVSNPFKLTGNADTGNLTGDVFVYRDAAKKIPMGTVRLSYFRFAATGNYRLMLNYFRGDQQVYASNTNILKAQARLFCCQAGPLTVNP